MEITLSLVSEGEMRGPRLLEDDEFAANLDRLRTETFNQSHPAQRQRTRQDVVQDTADGTESVECEGYHCNALVDKIQTKLKTKYDWIGFCSDAKSLQCEGCLW